MLWENFDDKGSLMLSIMLDREFLPTDVIVERPVGLDQVPTYSPLIGLGAVLAIVSVGIFAIMVHQWANYMMSSRQAGVWALSSVVLLGVSLGIAFLSQHDFNSKEAAESYAQSVTERAELNRKNLFANIELVYDVDKIDIAEESLDGLTRADGGSEESRIKLDALTEVTIIKDGEAFKGVLSQDPETYEPSLVVEVSVVSEAPVLVKQ